MASCQKDLTTVLCKLLQGSIKICLSVEADVALCLTLHSEAMALARKLID